jgi:trehalose synthase
VQPNGRIRKESQHGDEDLLQSTIDSLREGFGLTIAEAMWKRIPVLSNSRAGGPRQQVRDGVDGRLVRDPEDEAELRNAIHEMLASPADLRRLGQAAQRRVHDGLLVLGQLRSWGQLLAAAVEPRPAAG